MNQYQLQLIYEPLFFLVILVAFNLLFPDFRKRPLLLQTVFYAIMAALFVIVMIVTRINRRKLSSHSTHFTRLSQILTVVAVVIVGAFLYYMMK